MCIIPSIWHEIVLLKIWIQGHKASPVQTQPSILSLPHVGIDLSVRIVIPFIRLELIVAQTDGLTDRQKYRQTDRQLDTEHSD
jgi:hypothetical protein